MYTVYILRDSSEKLYKGMTSNLAQRLRDHRRGYTKSTKGFRDISVIYLEEFPDRKSARIREKYLKSATGRRFLQIKLHKGP